MFLHINVFSPTKNKYMGLVTCWQFLKNVKLFFTFQAILGPERLENTGQGLNIDAPKKIIQHWFSYFQIACKYLKCFTPDPLYIYWGDFCIWLLGYRIEFSCLYIQHRHYFISSLWYRWICTFLILSKSPSLIQQFFIIEI